jgi:ABC-type sugar transport system permease subunit
VDQPAPGDAAIPGEDWVGLENYRNVVTGDYFVTALQNSLLFTACAAPDGGVARHGRGDVLNRSFPGVGILRSIVLLPWVLPGAISAVAVDLGLHPSWGVINSTLRSLGLIDRSIGWLTDPNLARVGGRRPCLDPGPVFGRADHGGAVDA